ncbi:energy transducer TonB [Granulicella cerasi]|uniref:Energy transducer TonB n=1 Tax=Granulicella cerasi TaxID=741063 RepID=A0ABW1ZEV9_9BACT|nr:energy transducer TonB [Granulicella cerasi]
MFESSLMESAVATGPKNRWPAVVSVGLQAMIAVALVTVPLLHPATLNTLPKLMTLELPPLPQPPAPHPPEMPRVRVMTGMADGPAGPVVETLNHAVIGRVTPAPLSDLPPQTSPTLAFGSADGSTDALNAVMRGGAVGTGPRGVSVVPASGGGGSAVSHAAISSGVSAGLLLAPIQPVYPAIAKAAGQSGTVRVVATISAAGRVENARAVSGPVMLQAAAVDGVRTARYRPYMLNGKPTEVEATFEINFRLRE